MSRALPRPLVGLAATALAAGMLAAPMIAYADSTPTPTPTTSAAKSSPAPAADPTTSSSSPSAAEPSADAGAEPSDSPSAAASDDPSEAGTPSPTPTPDPSRAAGRVGSDAVAGPSPSATQSESARVAAQAAGDPAISLTKSASRTTVSKVGQVITYTFGVRNTGGAALANVAITDQLEGLSRLSCPASRTLDVGATLTCTANLTVTQDWIDFGAIDNSATVFADVVSGDDTPDTDYVGANASAHVSVDQKPDISLKASVSPSGTVDAGDRLRYAATATNTGNVTLTAARITSSLSKLDLDCDPSARATLAPGESVTCEGSYKVTTSDGRRGKVTTKLTASANGPYDDQRPSDSVTLRTKVTKISSSDPGLADTGGPDGALPVGLVGVAALLAGAGLIRHSRRA